LEKGETILDQEKDETILDLNKDETILDQNKDDSNPKVKKGETLNQSSDGLDKAEQVEDVQKEDQV